MEEEKVVSEESAPKKPWCKPELTVLDAHLTGTGNTFAGEGGVTTKGS
jgi:hypothetical protein